MTARFAVGRAMHSKPQSAKRCVRAWGGSAQIVAGPVQLLDYSASVSDDLSVRVERTEALELLAVVQATLNAIARSQDLTVGAAILTGIKAKLIDALEANP